MVVRSALILYMSTQNKQPCWWRRNCCGCYWMRDRRRRCGNIARERCLRWSTNGRCTLAVVQRAAKFLDHIFIYNLIPYKHRSVQMIFIHWSRFAYPCNRTNQFGALRVYNFWAWSSASCDRIQRISKCFVNIACFFKNLS